MPFVSIDDFVAQCSVVREACTSIGREPSTLKYTSAQTVVCGVDNAEVVRRAKNIGREVDELTQSALCGTPDQLIAKIKQWDAAGAESVYLQILDLDDLDHLDLIATQVLPHI
jgi:alkanesulfonate monooxygenase